eukprot:s2668_g8.t3
MFVKNGLPAKLFVWSEEQLQKKMPVGDDSGGQQQSGSGREMTGCSLSAFLALAPGYTLLAAGDEEAVLLRNDLQPIVGRPPEAFVRRSAGEMGAYILVARSAVPRLALAHVESHLASDSSPGTDVVENETDTSHLADDAVMGLVDRAVAAGMGAGAARPVVRLSKMARKSVGEARDRGSTCGCSSCQQDGWKLPDPGHGERWMRRLSLRPRRWWTAELPRTFRERHGLMVDDDFAYAFSSWEEAAANAGHAVADAWAEISQDLADDAVMGLVDQAVAAGLGAGAAARPVVRLSKMARKSVSEVAAARKKDSTPQMTSAAAGELAEFVAALVAWVMSMPSISTRSSQRAPKLRHSFSTAGLRWGIQVELFAGRLAHHERVLAAPSPGKVLPRLRDPVYGPLLVRQRQAEPQPVGLQMGCRPILRLTDGWSWAEAWIEAYRPALAAQAGDALASGCPVCGYFAQLAGCLWGPGKIEGKSRLCCGPPLALQWDSLCIPRAFVAAGCCGREGFTLFPSPPMRDTVEEVEVVVEETPSRPQPKVKKMPRRDPVEPSVPPAAERGRQPERLVPRAGSAASSSSRKEQPRGTKRPPWQDDEEHFDRLARVAHAEEGPRRALRTPTEIFRSRAGSRLFLGALPTAQNKALFPEIAFQITAMAQSPSISGYRIASQLVGSQLQRSDAWLRGAFCNPRRVTNAPDYATWGFDFRALADLKVSASARCKQLKHLLNAHGARAFSLSGPGTDCR